MPAVVEKHPSSKVQDETVESFILMANKGPRGDNNHQLEGMFKKVCPARPQPF
jgi:hypothetical protein